MTVRRVVPWVLLVLGFVVGGGSTADAQPGIGATGQRKGPPCIVDSVQARFTATGATYRSSGRCLYYMVTDAQGWRSNLVELPFTAEASVGYAGGVATPDVREVVLMTARDANTVARNDGSIRTTWRCSGGDQWRTDSVLDCERTQTDVVNLDIREVERLFDENLDRRDVRPISCRLTPEQRATLNAEFQAFQAREAGIRQAPGAAGSGVRRDGAAGGTARSAPPSAGTRTSALSTAPTITAPRPNGLMVSKKSRFVITPQSYFRGSDLEVEFTWLDAPAGQPRVFSWNPPVVLFNGPGADIPFEIFGGRTGAWTLRARVAKPQPGDFSPIVPFRYALQNPAATPVDPQTELKRR
jgi:hypothetical protein